MSKPNVSTYICIMRVSIKFATGLYSYAATCKYNTYTHYLHVVLFQVPNDAILKCDKVSSTSEKWFVNPDYDKSYVNKEIKSMEDTRA